MKYITTAKGPP